jgi:hypothetical protein
MRSSSRRWASDHPDWGPLLPSERELDENDDDYYGLEETN